MTGQHRWNTETGESYVVGSKATERPNLERQGNLLDHLEDLDQLRQWVGESDEPEDFEDFAKTQKTGKGAKCRKSLKCMPISARTPAPTTKE